MRLFLAERTGQARAEPQPRPFQRGSAYPSGLRRAGVDIREEQPAHEAVVM